MEDIEVDGTIILKYFLNDKMGAGLDCSGWGLARGDLL